MRGRKKGKQFVTHKVTTLCDTSTQKSLGRSGQKIDGHKEYRENFSRFNVGIRGKPYFHLQTQLNQDGKREYYQSKK